jgi:ribosome biogenesis GTPase A
MDLWLGNRKRILVLNREDMISTADRNAWAEYFTRRGTKVVFSNGQLGMVSKQNLSPPSLHVLKFRVQHI